MMKNDITYEYRVFTNRLIDVEDMEVGKCTSKVIEELKPKDKVDGRFFHTSDTDEWFFCWKGKLQKLNLKGDYELTESLEEVKRLIGDANDAVEDAKEAASEAKIAADAASAAVESIDSKAEQSDVDELSNVVDSLLKDVESKANQSDIEELSGKVALKSDLEGVVKTSELEGYATKEDIKGKQNVIENLNDIILGASAGATALQPGALDGYVTSENVYTREEIDASIGVAKLYIKDTILA